MELMSCWWTRWWIASLGGLFRLPARRHQVSTSSGSTGQGGVTRAWYSVTARSNARDTAGTMLVR